MKSFRIKIKNIVTAGIAASFLMATTTSCVNDLKRTPIVGASANNLYSNFANYNSLLASVYGGMGNGGESSGDGGSQLVNFDAGMSQYTRILYTLQELPTDEAKIAWNDRTVQNINKMTWDANDAFVNGGYVRLYLIIANCNEFMRNTTPSMLSQYGITGADATQATYMYNEVRFIRAQAYYNLLDLFGNCEFVDESFLPGSTKLPSRIAQADLFKWVESELLACAQGMMPAKTNVYGRADQAAAWALLSRLYLNASVYTGTDRSTDCITYCNKVIQAGYSLKPKYANLFNADNDQNNNEFILAVPFDGISNQTYGGSTYMIHAATGGSMSGSSLGINGGWAGLRVTPQFVGLFSDPNDVRGNFYTSGQSLNIDDLGNFNDGYAFIKYSNLTSTGAWGHDTSGNFCDADVPLYRLGEIYLNYAEAVLRGGSGGSTATALQYVNALRQRANTTPLAGLTLPVILDERARELNWEALRRTDLIRFGQFTGGTKLWQWKGGTEAGQSVDAHYNIYPIPATELVSNPDMTQNPGY